MGAKAISRLGDLCTGHDCWLPRPNIEACKSVFVNNLPVHLVGQRWASHCCIHTGDNHHGCHDGVTISGSSNVYIENVLVAREGDPVSCGSRVGKGSPDLECG